MDPLERSVKVRQEADLVMEAIHLGEILQPYGKVTLTGSYWLDVMVYPDIDLYIPPVTIEQLFGIGAQFARHAWVRQVIFNKSDLPDLPGGLYLKPSIEHGDWGRPWKIDIWSLEETIIAERMSNLQHFKDKMTPALREQIIYYKYSVINAQQRTPMYSGFQIYRAFIDEGLTDFGDVTRYLVDHGIGMD